MFDLEEEEEVGESKAPICDDEDFETEEEMVKSDSVNGKRRKNFFRERNRSSQAFDINVARVGMAKMVIMDDLPISVAEFEGFKNFLYTLQPLLLANPITTAMVEEEILKLYEVENPKIMRLLQKNESKLALSVDILTADESNEYMAITARFVDDSWVLQSRIMRLIHVQCPYSAEMLSDKLVNFLMDWNVDQKLSAVTIDNCSTNDAMMSMLLERVSIVPNGMGVKFFPIRCCAQILNVIIKDQMKVHKHAIQKIRESFNFWRSTSKRRNNFEKCARDLGVTYTKKLVLDLEPKWSSTYVMLGTALEYKDVLIRLTKREEAKELIEHFDEEDIFLPTESEWEKAKELCEHLEVFYRLIEMHSGTKHLTANAFIGICEIRLSINRWLKSSNDEIKNMATNMMAKFDTYWEAVYGVLAVAIVLDPRLRIQYIEFFFSEIYGDEAEHHVKRVHDICSDLVKEYQSNAASGSGSVKKNGDRSIDYSSAAKKGIGSYTEKFKLFLSQKNCHKPVISELDRYLNEDLLDMDSNFDILDWWKGKKDIYPILSAIAKDILAIPLSTVACETTFSKGRKLLGPHRNELQPNTLNAIMCTQDWFWKGYIPEYQIANGTEDFSDYDVYFEEDGDDEWL